MSFLFEGAGHRFPIAQALARASTSADRLEGRLKFRLRGLIGVAGTGKIEQDFFAQPSKFEPVVSIAVAELNEPREFGGEFMLAPGTSKESA